VFASQRKSSSRPTAIEGRRKCRHHSVVERTLAWLVGFGCLTVHFERRSDLRLALLHLACAFVCFRLLQATFSRAIFVRLNIAAGEESVSGNDCAADANQNLTGVLSHE
jgi:hypothetical protein